MSIVSRFVWLPAVFAILSAPATAAYDRDYYTTDDVYSLTARWLIAINLKRQSCFLGINYANGINVEIGLDRSRADPAYFMLFASKAWEYQDHQDYDITVKYDGVSTWGGTGSGVRVNALRGVALEGLDKAAIAEMAGRGRFNLKIGGHNFGNFPLTGTRQALAKMDQCVAEVADGRISLEAIAKGYDGGEAPPPDKGGTARGGEPSEAPAPRAPDKPAEGAIYSTGTGFFVNGDGYLLTNAHVVDGCEDAFVRQGNAGVEPATIVARETTNDLAILKVARKNAVFGKFRGVPQIRLGDSIVMFGYPLTGYLSRTGNISMGLVSALTGSGDDAAQMQISAPVQSGNSGGAVVDQSGHVVGIVVAKSNTTPYGAGEGGVEVIQNANFAIKAGIAQFFLDAHQVRYTAEPPGDDLKTPDVTDIARAFSAQVICEVKK